MSDIFQQVEEELRQDQMRALWQRYGAYIIGAAVAIVAATFGNQLWQGYVASKNEAASAAFASAAATAAGGDLTAYDTVIDGNHAGYAALAGFAKADGMLADGNRAGAITLLDQIAGQAGLPRSLRDLAGLKAALASMESGSSDDVAIRLAPLLGDGRPYRHAAREAAAINAYRNNDIEQARNLFAGLAGDFEAPQGVRARAAEMLLILGPAATELSAPEAAVEEAE